MIFVYALKSVIFYHLFYSPILVRVENVEKKTLLDDAGSIYFIKTYYKVYSLLCGRNGCKPVALSGCFRHMTNLPVSLKPMYRLPSHISNINEKIILNISLARKKN